MAFMSPLLKTETVKRTERDNLSLIFSWANWDALLTTQPSRKAKKEPKKKMETNIPLLDGLTWGNFDYDSIDPDCCNLDPKVTLFGVFQVGWTTVDVGSDGYQVYDYYTRAHYW